MLSLCEVHYCASVVEEWVSEKSSVPSLPLPTAHVSNTQKLHYLEAARAVLIPSHEELLMSMSTISDQNGLLPVLIL